MKYIDVHSHLTEPRFEENREQILSDMKNQGIGTISIGTDMATSRQAAELASEHENMWATIGQHPVDNKDEVFDTDRYRSLYKEHSNTVVAIGECGLDYYWPAKDMERGVITLAEFEQEKKRQKTLFEKQIDLSVELGIPLMLHVRSAERGDAHRDVLEILSLKEAQFDRQLQANFHFFTETPEIAREIIARGYYVSFPGVITFADLDETIVSVPLDRIMSETDAPYAAPVPHRGKNSSPLMIENMIIKIAEVKDEDFQTVSKQLLLNAQTFFQLHSRG